MHRYTSQVARIALSVLWLACGPTAADPSGGIDSGSSSITDTDGDWISDQDEGRADGVDTDGDGTPDYVDDDSDGDGIPDYREAGDDRLETSPADSDYDGIPDFRDTDSDGNGRADGVDGVDDLDGDGIGNFADRDDDGDGIGDTTELGAGSVPVDTDGDGTPDYHDGDSDGDGILDRDEGMVDADDGVPAFRDPDSDGDCVPDSAEAGDADPETRPVNTDADLRPDFFDLDSDNDGLLDGLEDANCNGVLDPGESSRIHPDSDGDGVSDLVEHAAGTDPTDPLDNPQANGDFVFVVPYMEPASPSADTLDFSTAITQADVVFAMDTTGSMGEEIDGLKASVVSLINTIRAQIPNSGFGVVGYEDYPISTYGSPGDEPFYLLHRVMTANTSAGLASIQDRVNAYTLGGGYDSPESGWEMLYQIATGAGTSQGNAAVPAFNPATAFPASPPPGEQTGTIGGVGYRAGSLPIVVWMTDACNHNSSLGYSYSSFIAASSTLAINQLSSKSIKVIGVVSAPQVGGCGIDDARVDALAAINATGAVVPPSAWGPVGARPASCSLSQCCTGIDGAGEPASGGMCPLLFGVNGSNGAGMGAAVAAAVKVLTSYAELDVGVLAQDDPGDPVDAVAAFIERLETNNLACSTAFAVSDRNGDGVNDTFESVTPGSTVCFDVIPRDNTTVPPTTEPQMFSATVKVRGDGVTVLDTRTVWFLVPPEIPDIPID